MRKPIAGAAHETVAERRVPTGEKPVEAVIWPILVIVLVICVAFGSTAVFRIVEVSRRAGVLAGNGLRRGWGRAADHNGRSIVFGRQLRRSFSRAADHGRRS